MSKTHPHLRPYGRTVLSIWLVATVAFTAAAAIALHQKWPSGERLRAAAMTSALIGVPLGLSRRRPAR